MKDGPENDRRITTYMHCGMCLDEWKNPDHPDSEGTSPETYARLSVGFTKRGLQVWCVRHGVNVMHVDFEGQKHPANTTRRAPPPEKAT